MRKYRNVLVSLLAFSLLNGCNSSTTDNSSSSTTQSSQSSVTSSSDVTLMQDMSESARLLDEEAFIDTTIQRIVPTAVASYVPDSYVDEVLALEQLQADRLKNNEEFTTQLKAYYALANTTNLRLIDDPALYDIIASLMSQLYEIIYNYLFSMDIVSSSSSVESSSSLQSSSEASSTPYISIVNKDFVEDSSVNILTGWVLRLSIS